VKFKVFDSIDAVVVENVEHFVGEHLVAEHGLDAAEVGVADVEPLLTPGVVFQREGLAQFHLGVLAFDEEGHEVEYIHEALLLCHILVHVRQGVVQNKLVRLILLCVAELVTGKLHLGAQGLAGVEQLETTEVH